MHLEQRGAQIGQQRQHRHGRLPEGGTAAGCRALELVFDDLRDAIDLELDARVGAALTGLGPAETGADHGQRGFQAVRQIAERVAVANDAVALRFEQRIEAAGDAGELARIALAELRGAAGLQRRDLLLQTPHWRERAPHHPRHGGEQHQIEGSEPARHALPEQPQLAHLRRRAVGRGEHQLLG